MEIGLAPALSSNHIKREDNTLVCKTSEIINVMPSESNHSLQIKQEPSMQQMESFFCPQLNEIKEEPVEMDGLQLDGMKWNKMDGIKNEQPNDLTLTNKLTRQSDKDVPQGLIPPIEMEDEEGDLECLKTTNTKFRAVKTWLNMASTSRKCTNKQRLQKYKDRYCDKIHSNSFSNSNLYHKKAYGCKTCGKEFKRSDLLTDHMKVHQRKRPYPCDQCGMMFVKPAYLKIHLRRHAGERSFSCDKCDKKFFDKYDLRVHQRDHTGERPYVCQECGKSFKRIYILNKHKKTHSIERPFQCHVCGKAYKYGYCYRSHMKVHPT